VSQEELRVLGIDPGTWVIGWGVVTPAGASFRRVASGAVDLGSSRPLGERLGEIRSAVVELCARHAPAAVALEKAFVAHNVQSAFRLGEARGAVLIAAAEAGVPVFEYAPASSATAAPTSSTSCAAFRCGSGFRRPNAPTRPTRWRSRSAI
jgi:crossover junction endodeoxyribonuclease RuvC